MKKLLSIILSILLLLTAVSGCNDKKKPTENNETPASSTEQTSDIQDNASSELTSSEEASEEETTSEVSSEETGSTDFYYTPVEETVSEATSSDEAVSSEDTSTEVSSTGTTASEETVTSEESSSEEETTSQAESEEEEDGERPLRETLQGGVNFSCIDSGGSGVKKASQYIYDREYYDLVAEAGFNNIRLPVGFGSLVVSEAPEYLLDNEALRYIDTAINNALDAGLVVILDNHHNSGYTEPEKFKRIWEQLAERYQFYPEELMFELVNEPTAANISDSNLNELQMQTVEIIRKTNPTRTIALAPNEWNGCWKLWGVEIPSKIVDGVFTYDENIIISVHIYSPMRFSHQGMDGNATNVHWEDTMKKEITNNLEVCADYEERTGRTVWISEWGCYQGAHDDVEKCMAEYYKHFTSECARLDLAYAVWEFNAGFGIYNNTTKSLKSYLVDNMVIEW